MKKKQILVLKNVSTKSKIFEEQNDILVSTAKNLDIELTFKKNSEIIYSLSDSNESQEKLKKYDAVLFFDKDIFLCKKLESLGMKVFNSSEAIANCDNKAKTYEILSQNAVKIPKTFILPLTYHYQREYYSNFVFEMEKQLSYPLVAKKWYGSCGEQVFLIKDSEELWDLIDKEQGKELLFQEYFPECHGTDIRMYVVNNEVVASMKRISTNGDFRSNLAVGGTAEKYLPNENEKQIAISVSKMLGCDFCGVDFLESNNGIVICEVNSNAFIKNISNVTGVNVAECILKFILSKI